MWSYQSPCLSPGFRCGPSPRFEVVLEDLCHHKHGSSWISRSSMRRRDPDMLLAPWMLNCKQPERSAYWTSLSFLWLRSLRGYSGPGCNFDAGLRVQGSGARLRGRSRVHEVMLPIASQAASSPPWYAQMGGHKSDLTCEVYVPLGANHL